MVSKRPTVPRTDRQAAALATMQARFPDVARWFKRVYGLVLSEQVAVLAAFLESLDEPQRAALARMGLGAAGVTRCFRAGGLERPLKAGLDARLDFRYSVHPPEFVTVLAGGPDGHHVGLMYEDSEHPAWLVVENFARDDGTSSAIAGRGWSVVDGLVPLVNRHARDGLDTSALRSAIEAFADVNQDIVTREHATLRKTFVRLQTLDGCGPVLPPRVKALPTWPSKQARRAALTSSDPIVMTWVETARRELEAKNPGLALMLGRDVWFLRCELRQPAAFDLLVRAYQTIGRQPFADILLLHAAHRDLQSVDAYA